MFKKLVSNLPFNPSMIHQVSFYAKRLRNEEAIRRIGSVFMVLALIVQCFAYFSPAQASTTCSDNDLIRCGIDTKDELIQKFNQNPDGLQSIFSAFHISVNELNNVTPATVVSDPAYNYYSVGRNPSGADVQTYKDPNSSNYFYFRKLYTATNNRVVTFGALTGTTASGQQFWILKDCANIVIQGETITPVSTPSPTPTPIQGTSYLQSDCSEVRGRYVGQNNKRIDILFYSLTAKSYGSVSATSDGDGYFSQSISNEAKNGTEGFYAQIAGTGITGQGGNACGAPQNATLDIIKDNLIKGNVKRGNQITYRLQYRNTGAGISQNTVITDTLPEYTTYVSTSQTNGFNLANSLATWNTGSIGTSYNYYYIDVTVKINDNAPNNQVICNTASIKSDNGSLVNSNQVCNTVEVVEDCPFKPNVGIPKSDKTRCLECPYVAGINFDDPKCIQPTTASATCQYLRLVASTTPNIISLVREFEGTAAVTGNAKVTAYWYDFDGDGIYDVKHNASTIDPNKDKVNWEYAKTGTYTAKLLIKTSAGDKTSTNCTQTVKLDEAPKPVILNVSKRVRNITQGLEDGTSKQAQAGDTLEYLLSTANAGGTTSRSTVLDNENLADVKLYADITDIGDAEYIDTAKTTIKWKPIDIVAGQTITKVIKVRVKNPIPNTPASQADLTGFDNIMTNVYGSSTINVRLPKSIIKRVESTNSTLPNTGPGTSLVFGFITTVLVGYFFARSKLLTLEIDLIKQEYTSGA